MNSNVKKAAKDIDWGFVIKVILFIVVIKIVYNMAMKIFNKVAGIKISNSYDQVNSPEKAQKTSEEIYEKALRSMDMQYVNNPGEIDALVNTLVQLFDSPINNDETILSRIRVLNAHELVYLYGKFGLKYYDPFTDSGIYLDLFGHFDAVLRTVNWFGKSNRELMVEVWAKCPDGYKYN